MNQPSFRSYTQDHPLLAVTVRTRLEREKNKLADALVEMYAQNWDEYNRRAGEIRGLITAIEMCIAVEDELNERK